MKHPNNALALSLVFFLSFPAIGSVTQTYGEGSAVAVVDAKADFESLNALADNPYSEDGLLFTRTNLSFNNNALGYAAYLDHPGFVGFSGNYMYGSSFGYSNPGFFSIMAEGQAVFAGLEFTIGNGNGDTDASHFQDVYWRAYLQGTLVGSGNISHIAAGSVLGFVGLSGFDELRYTDSFDATKANPAFDKVRAQFAVVPVPAAFWLFASAMFAWRFGGRNSR